MLAFTQLINLHNLTSVEGGEKLRCYNYNLFKCKNIKFCAHFHIHVRVKVFFHSFMVHKHRTARLVSNVCLKYDVVNFFISDYDTEEVVKCNAHFIYDENRQRSLQHLIQIEELPSRFKTVRLPSGNIISK